MTDKDQSENEISEAMRPTNDYVFKRIFSYEGKENITKDLLESITNYKIDSIDIDKSQILDKDLKNDKVGVLDIRAVLNGNIQADIEMQVVTQDSIEKRMLFYWSKLYSKGIKSGKDYEVLNKTIVILIANFELDSLKKIPKFHTEFELREKDYPEVVLTDALEFHIISLTKMLDMLKENKVDINDNLTLWLKFIINPNEIGGVEMEKNKNLKEAKVVLDEINGDEHERELAEMRLKYIRDQNARKKYVYI